MEKKNWHAKPVEQVFSELETTKEGLTITDAEKRLEIHGPNLFEQHKTRSPIEIFLAQFTNFLILLLVAAFLLSIFTQTWSHTFVLFIIIALNILMGFILEHKAEQALASLRKIFTHKAYVRRAGEEIIISAHDLVPGDIVLLKSGSRIPADLRLHDVSNLKIDESTLTGESIPPHKITQALPESTPLPDRTNIAFCGSHVTYGSGEGVVFATGLKTELGHIAHLIQKDHKKTPLQQRLDHLSKILGIISIFLVAVIFLIGLGRGMNILELFNYAIALLVAVVPESLPTITTLALAIGVIKMAKSNAIIRKLPSVETLASVNIICADKTGTLTKNELTASKIWTPKIEIKVQGIGYQPEPKFTPNEKIKEIIKNGVLCNDAELAWDEKTKKWQIIGDPTEGALIVLGEKSGIKREILDGNQVHKIPFDEQRLRMSVVYKQKDHHIVFTKGAPRAILNISKIDADTKVAVEQKIEELSKSGYRLLAFSMKKIPGNSLPSDADIEKDMDFQGLVAMIDPPDEHVQNAIMLCKKANIRPIILTGDHKLTALAVARQVGLDVGKENLMKGEELEKISEEDLVKKIDEISVFARITPMQKTKILSALSKKGYLIAMTGDGVNDAPALKQADIGIAMGKRGQDVAKEAADIILIDDRFYTIVKAIEYARTIYDNIKKFLKLLLTGNFKEIFIVMVAFVFGLPLPFTALQILWINLITDSFPALALAFERPSHNIMEQKPRDPKSKIIGNILKYAFSVGLFGSLLGIVLFLYYLDDHVKAQTIIFSFVVFFELSIVFSIRADKPFWQEKHFFSNKYLILAVIFSALLQLLAIYSPLSGPMKTVRLGIEDWVIIIGLCMMSFLILEVVKTFSKKALE